CLTSWPSFVLQIPGAIPIRCGRILRKALKALEQRRRRSVTGHSFERGGKGLARFVETPRAVSGEPFGVPRSQCSLHCAKFALPAHDLIDGLRLALADHDQPIDLAQLETSAAHRRRRLRDQAAAAIDLVGAPSSLEARFTVSPITVKLIMNSEPMLPTSASPVAIPILMS